MISYIIIESATLADLQEQVNRAMRHGYVPIGGVSVSPENKKIGQTYLQAMVLEEK
jgi:hypothetical protein